MRAAVPKISIRTKRKASRRTFDRRIIEPAEIIPADWFAAAFIYIIYQWNGPSNFEPPTFHLQWRRPARKILSSPIKSQSYRRGHASANSHPRKHTHTHHHQHLAAVFTIATLRKWYFMMRPWVLRSTPAQSPRIGARAPARRVAREIWWWDLAVKKRRCEKSPVLLLIFFWWRKPTQGAATDKSTLFKRRTAPAPSRYLRFTGSFFPFSQSQPREKERERDAALLIFMAEWATTGSLAAQSYLKNTSRVCTLLNAPWTMACLDVWIIYNPPANKFKSVARSHSFWRPEIALAHQL